MDPMQARVATVAFSKNQYLVDALRREFPGAVVNGEGTRLNGDKLVDYLSGADAAIIGLEKINGNILDKLPSLKIISKFGVGLDNIDLDACAARNIKVGWTAGVNRRAVAEMALGFMLMLSRNLYSTSNQLKQLQWNKDGGRNITGKTIGIIGVGHIGRELIRLLAPFQCKILVNDVVDIESFAVANGAKCVSKEELFATSDLISVHTPLTDQTTNLFCLNIFKQMKPTSFLINTARGGIVNEADLKYALQHDLIAGAALDVYGSEPPGDQELLLLPNLICTPHTGGNSYEAVVAMGLSAIEHLVAFRDNQTVKP
jgi:phosphoglycerate dehydrogenase-like enzyme